jgi:selenocysteine lyase/cysteine desulfurase
MLTPARPGLWAGILTLRAPGKQAIDLAAAIERSHRAHVRAVRWPGNSDGALRLSPNIYTTHDDIEKLVQGLQLALR